MENKTKLYQKILNTQSDISNVGKDGNNTAQNYKFAQWGDIIKEVRKAAIKNNLLINITTAKKEMSEGENKEGKKFTTCNITVRIMLIDVETGESIKHFYHGEGRDYGDKSIYKSYTGAVKYGIIEIFLVPIGDDPEVSETSPDAFIAMQKQSKELIEKTKELNEEIKFLKVNVLKSVPSDLQSWLKKTYEPKEIFNFIMSINLDWDKLRDIIESENQPDEGEYK